MSRAIVAPTQVRPGLVARVVAPACIAAAMAVVALGRTDPHHAAIALVVFGVIAGVAAYDIGTLLAPNALIYPGTAFALLSAFTLGRDAGIQALGGAFVAFVVMLIIALAGRGKMGMGDVKMAALCGAAVGLRMVLPMLLLTFTIGAVIAAGALLSRRRRPSDVMAFTPLLAAAAVIVTLTAGTYLNH